MINFIIKCKERPVGIGGQILLGLQTLVKYQSNINHINSIFFVFKNGDKNNTYSHIFENASSTCSKAIELTKDDEYCLRHKENYSFKDLFETKYKHKISKFETCKNNHINILLNASNFAYPENINNAEIKIYKQYAKKIIVKNDVLKKITKTTSNKKILGVHVRTTDMNAIHERQYGLLNTEDFISQIDNELKTKTYSHLFIAADNKQSIDKIKNKFASNIKIITNNCCHLSAVEKDRKFEYNKYLRNVCYDKYFVIESFIDMLSLASCDTIIKRVSSFSLCSVFFANKEQKIIFLEGRK